MSVGAFVEKAQRYSSGVRHLRPEDVILSSYPKSGNTWVRFFFCNLIQELEGRDSGVTFEQLDSAMPELAVSDLARPWPHPSVPRIVKTHNPYWFAFRKLRTIYVVRDPRDAVISHFHMVTGKKNARFEGSFSEFIRTKKWGIHNWFRHVESWLPHHPITVKYEDLLKDDVAEYRRLVDELKIPVTNEQLCTAVQASRFSNLKKVVETHGHAKDDYKPGFNFMRKGESRQWADTFSEDDLKFYEHLCTRSPIRLYA